MKRRGVSLRRIVLWGLTSFYLFLGCASSTMSLRSTSMPSPSELVNRLRKHASHLETFQGWARLTVVSESESFIASLRLRAMPPDSLWLKIEGPMGVDALVGRFSGDHVLLYSPWENTVYEGSIQRFQTLQILPFPVYFQDLVRGIIGLPLPVDGIDQSVVTLTPDSKQYLVDLGTQAQLSVTPRGPAVTRWEAFDTEGRTLWTWSGERFRKQKGVWIPYLIRITQDNPKQRVTLFYETIKINRRLNKQWSHFRIPEGAYRFEF